MTYSTALREQLDRDLQVRQEEALRLHARLPELAAEIADIETSLHRLRPHCASCGDPLDDPTDPDRHKHCYPLNRGTNPQR